MDDDIDEMRIALLFREVIRQAAKDAFGISPTANEFDKIKSRIFLNGNKDLQTICEMADIEPKDIVYIMKSSDENSLKYNKINDILKNQKKGLDNFCKSVV